MEYKYYIIGACTGILIYIILMEWLRTDRSRLFWRICSSVVAVLSLALLIIPLKYSATKQVNKNEINILTNGATTEQIAGIKGTTYAYPEMNSGNRRNIQTIQSLEYFLKSRPDIKKVNLYGYGLGASDLNLLNGLEMSFNPAIAPSGIVACNWPQKIQATTEFILQGKYQNTTSNAVDLILEGAGLRIDSLHIKANNNSNFSFSSFPKQNGRAVYELVALHGKDTLGKEMVPFEVIPQRPVKVLILASFPDFEYKFLKKWLYEHQYPLAIRSQISKNKFSTDFLNLSAFNLTSVNSSTLHKFDLLIVDESELAALSLAEQSAISNAASEGLGVLIRTSESKTSAKLAAQFSIYEVPKIKDKLLRVRAFKTSKIYSALPLEQQLYLRSSGNDQAIFNDASGKVLVNSKLSGQGKIMQSVISSTYFWMLDGKVDDYSNYWSELISNAARKQRAQNAFSYEPAFPEVHQKLRLIQSNEAVTRNSDFNLDQLSLSSRRNMELPFIRDAFAWPEHEGWNLLKSDGQEQMLYIYPKNSWRAVKASQNVKATQEFEKRNKKISYNSESTIEKEEIEVSKWWFFAAFLLSVSFLWYEDRILKAN